MDNPIHCLICGAPLSYRDKAASLTCAGCGKTFMSYAQCERGHYICDACHSKAGLLAIGYICQETSETDAFALAATLMRQPAIHMHGPEHHVLAGAALLTAFYNSGGKIDLTESLTEIINRGKEVPGGTCGYWGCCGAAVSAGTFLSIALKATPLSDKAWGLSNRLTAECLAAIGDLGGPRCCKRDAFLSIGRAIEFVRGHLGISMSLPAQVTCEFFPQNQECLGKRCPFHPRRQRSME